MDNDQTVPGQPNDNKLGAPIIPAVEKSSITVSEDSRTDESNESTNNEVDQKEMSDNQTENNAQGLESELSSESAPIENQEATLNQTPEAAEASPSQEPTVEDNTAASNTAASNITTTNITPNSTTNPTQNTTTVTPATSQTTASVATSVVEKKKSHVGLVFLIIGIVFGVAAIVVALIFLIPALTRIDYSTAYRAAKELKPEIQTMYDNYDCEYVEKYLDSSSTSTKQYNEYIENCRTAMSDTGNVSKLGETDGVKKNSDIKTQYDIFKSAYDSVIAGNEDLNAKLDIYAARHKFAVLTKDIDYETADAEINAAADALIESGNDDLKEYGEGWKEKYLAAAHAYQEYEAADDLIWTDYDRWESMTDERKALQATKADANDELKSYITSNKPDIKSLYPLNLDNISKIDTEFDKLYDMIADAYEENYNSKSGDCTEFLDEVVCD